MPSDEDDDGGSTDSFDGGGAVEGEAQQQQAATTTAGKRSRDAAETANRPTFAISAALEREFDTYRTYRLVELNKHRSSGAVRAITVDNDTKAVLRFLRWVQATEGVEIHALASVFRSAQLADLAQSYVRHLTRSKGRKFSTVASYLTGLVNVTRFVLAVCKARSKVPVDESPLQQLVALHKQCMQRSRVDGKYDACSATKTNWLEWADVQRARVASVWAYRACCRDEEADPDEKLARARDALLMSLLTLQPPDRVGIARNLQLGVTLKRGSGRWSLVCHTRR